MADSSTTDYSRTRRDGYFDNVYSIFEAYNHPIVLVEYGAMRWMGLRLFPDENLDLLVRDSQADDILTSLLATGCFELVDQDIDYRFQDPYTKQVPRLRDMRCAPGPFACVNLWTEAVYMLRVNDAELVAVMDIHAWNVNLVEERFGTVPETAYLTFTAQTEQGTRILPKISSSAKGVPIFVPSIPKMCDAVLDQLRYRTSHAEDCQGKTGNRPAYHLRNFVRYLYLERQSQRDLLLPLLAERNRAEMEQRIKAFKRKPTLAMIKETLQPHQALLIPHLPPLSPSPPPPQPHTVPAIGPGQKAALLEAYTATISLLPSPLRPSFIIIGGAALVLLGSPRRTEDVDFAVSGAALFAFEEGARSDPRFSQGAVAEWTYSCQGKGIKDVGVPLEFLQMGGAFAPTIKVVEAVGGGFRAGVGELARMKARAYVGRGEDNDRGDFCFLLEKMVETGEGFEGMEVEGEDLDSMEATAAECGGRFLELLKELLGTAGY